LYFSCQNSIFENQLVGNYWDLWEELRLGWQQTRSENGRECSLLLATCAQWENGRLTLVGSHSA